MTPAASCKSCEGTTDQTTIQAHLITVLVSLHCLCCWGCRYTVEFGVVREGGDIKAFGAGILSSYGELQHMAAGGAKLLPFDPFQPQPKMSYKDG